MNTNFKKIMVSILIASMGFPAFQGVAFAQTSQQGQQKLTEQQLSALVAPIALYPDSLVSQVLMASTYPVQVAEAYQWYQSNKNLKGNALTTALQSQQWDQSVKSLVHFPQVLVMMGTKLSWTQNLGDAVLAQQSDVLAAIQSLRAKAQAQGNLSSNSQQTVSTQGSGSTQVIVIQPTNPQVVYVPTYNPTVVYGGWPYPAYPPVAYYPPGYVAGTALLSFGVGMAVGAALWGGCHWGGGGWGGGGNSLTVNNNTYNNFSRQNVSNWRDGSNNFQNGSWSHSGSGGLNNGLNDRNLSQERNNLRQNMSRDGFGSSDRGFDGSDRNFSGESRNQERDNLRQNLDKGGLSGDRSGGDRSFGGDHSGGDRNFGGGDRSFGGDRSGGDREFGGGDRSFGGGDRSFGGGDRSFGGGDRSFGGGDRSFGGGHFGGGRR